MAKEATVSLHVSVATKQHSARKAVYKAYAKRMEHVYNTRSICSSRDALSDQIISTQPSRSRSSRICTAPASSRGNPSSPSTRDPHPASRSAVSSVLWKQKQMESKERCFSTMPRRLL